MIDILTIIDNPLNDIALSSVLTSKIYGISNNELFTDIANDDFVLPNMNKIDYNIYSLMHF